MVFVHGFGASLEQYREQLPFFLEHHDTFAVDLLGLGMSDKPPDVTYSIDLWSDQLADFVTSIVGGPAIVIGNSIGSLCSITAAARSTAPIEGLVLLNCAGGMNSKLLLEEDWTPLLKLVIRPVLSLFDFVLTSPSTRELARSFFENTRSRENVNRTLQTVYLNQDRVDDELVEQILRPAKQDTAFDVFCKILSGPPGTYPAALLPAVQVPILVIWGSEDPWTPIKGPLGKYMVELAQQRGDVQMNVIPCGHCPHDDAPDEVNALISTWLKGNPKSPQSPP
uniref:AB hydrolase-1 domain-containing protein n=1 Tax=Rhizochromulina marina TaxID=1034831 RepID=A0A7S2RL55_9STRA